MRINSKAIKTTADLTCVINESGGALKVFESILCDTEDFFELIKPLMKKKIIDCGLPEKEKQKLIKYADMLCDDANAFFESDYKEALCLIMKIQKMRVDTFRNSLPKDASSDNQREKDTREKLVLEEKRLQQIQDTFDKYNNNKNVVLCFLAVFFFPQLEPYFDGNTIDTFSRKEASYVTEGFYVENYQLFHGGNFIRALRRPPDAQDIVAECSVGKDGDFFFLRNIFIPEIPNVSQYSKNMSLPGISAISLSVSDFQWAMVGFDGHIYSNVPFFHKCTDYQFVDVAVSHNHVLGMTLDGKLFSSIFGLIENNPCFYYSELKTNVRGFALDGNLSTLTYSNKALCYRINGLSIDSEKPQVIVFPDDSDITFRQTDVGTMLEATEKSGKTTIFSISGR